MFKNFFKVMPAVAFLAIAFSFCSCSDTDSDIETPEKPDTENPEPEPEPEPENYNKVFAGEWSLIGSDDPTWEWIIDDNGMVRALRVSYVMNGASGSKKIWADSSFVECDKMFTLDYNPDFQTVTFTENENTRQASVLSVADDKIEFKEEESANTLILLKNGSWCGGAPESIEGFHLSANRYKAHGLRFYPNGVCTQNFYYDDVVDNLISEYTYTKGEGNKAKIVYHIQFRLNPDKQKIFTGVTTAKFSDITFDVKGELDMTFFTRMEGGKNADERYLGEFEGNVHTTVTNNNTGKVTEQDITGHKYFALTAVNE